ncbi:hypothetical protein FKP32DRAFT_1561188, partial [Trametes sanguinea]
DERERKMYHQLQRWIVQRTSEVVTTKAGPCTIVADISAEYRSPNMDGLSRVFLLRDARLFNRTTAEPGHAVIQFIPYAGSTSNGGPAELERAPPLIVLRVWIGGSDFPFMIDTGSQIDCIHATVWRALGGLDPLLPSAGRLVNVTGTRFRCLGVWRTIITVGTISSPIDLHVVEDLSAPGILGRPWQRSNRMWMNDTVDDVYIGIQSRDGFHTFGMLVTSIEAQRRQWREAALICGSVSAEDTMEVDFAESHRVRELMDPVQMQDESKPTSKAVSAETEVNLSLDSPPKLDPWQLKEDPETGGLEPEAEASLTMRENDMYRSLLWQFCIQRLIPRLKNPSSIESFEIMESDQLDLAADGMTGISTKEELFLLRNLMARIDGRFREGHAVLRMVYFPHETERMRRANEGLNPEGVQMINRPESEILREEDIFRKLLSYYRQAPTSVATNCYEPFISHDVFTLRTV